MKSVMESPERKENSSKTSMRPELGGDDTAAGCVRNGRAAASSRMGGQSASPGVEPATYRTTGPTFEHGNLEPSVVPSKHDERPSHALSRSRGGASVVVGARESRAQGEGRQ